MTKPPVASVRLQPDQAAVTVGATVQLSAAALDGNGTAMSDRAIAWTTSNPSVAAVNGSGLVTGVVSGTASITAASEGKSSSATVTVSQVVARVDVNPVIGFGSGGPDAAIRRHGQGPEGRRGHRKGGDLDER